MSQYSDSESCPDGMIEITIERGGEFMRTFVKEGATVQALIEDGQLRGISTSNTRVNGAPSTEGTSLKSGDSVVQVPKSGKQGS